jgi:DNA-binding transcriptional LysR family regulator
MELHQIRYFLAACDTLNFTRAAELCGVSVPSLSRAVRALEDELGGQLFRRERHLTHLTDLGRLMQQHFATVQAAADAAKRDAQGYTTLSGATLRLGVFASIATEPFTGFLGELRTLAPDMELRVWEANCEEIETALLAGEIDVALTSAPRSDERIRKLVLFEESYLVAFASGHRFERMNAVSMRELSGENYIKRLHCEFHSNFALLGVARPYDAVKVCYVGEREDWIQAMVKAGLGCAVVPEFQLLLPGVLTRKLIDPQVSRDISLATVASRPHSAPVAAAVSAARKFAWPNKAETAGAP